MNKLTAKILKRCVFHRSTVLRGPSTSQYLYSHTFSQYSVDAYPSLCKLNITRPPKKEQKENDKYSSHDRSVFKEASMF